MGSIMKNHKDDHDPKTCFRCRLYDLFEELKDKNEPEFMYFSMAEASASILSQLGPNDTILFMKAIYDFIREDQEERRNQTKH